LLWDLHDVSLICRKGSEKRDSRSLSLSSELSKSALSLAKMRYPEEWDEDHADVTG